MADASSSTGTLPLLGLAATARLPPTAFGLAPHDAAAYSLHVFSDFDRERRRIEEALHDGVQQDLAATAAALELARALLDTDPAAARSELEDLTAEVEAALERVRVLARTVYPSILPARGLTDALRSLDVETADLERYPLEIEEAVYFSCAALRSRANRARVWSDGDALRLELLGVTAVEDDGLSEARERIAEAGGQLELSAGRVSASVPLR
jgi:signal transduction histidine kinase